jgi:hypothetical protein
MAQSDLIPFKPGQCGNPKGRPKGTRNFSTFINKIMNQKIDVIDKKTGKPIKMTMAEAVVMAQFKQAANGSTRAFNSLIDRAEGKVADKIQHSGVDGAPLAAPVINVTGVTPDKSEDI